MTKAVVPASGRDYRVVIQPGSYVVAAIADAAYVADESIFTEATYTSSPLGDFWQFWDAYGIEWIVSGSTNVIVLSIVEPLTGYEEV